MSLLFASIGTILGSIYFTIADYSIIVASIGTFFLSTTAFTALMHRRKEIMSLLVFFLLVFFNYNLRSQELEYKDLSQFLNSRSDYQLHITNHPKDKFFKSEFIVEARLNNPSLSDRLRELFLPYRFLAKADSYLGLEKNDIVSIKSEIKLKKLESYKIRFYRKDKVFFNLENKDIVFVDHQHNFISKLQKSIKKRYSKTLSPENSQIVTSLLFGSRSTQLPQGFISQIRKLGLGHFFAASGFHLLILTLILNWFFNIIKLDMRLSSGISLFITLIYAALAGFSPSIVRAGIFVASYLILKLLNRKALSIRLLIYMAGIILFFDPYTIFDIGFQLSYLATLAILTWTPLISDKLKDSKLPKYLQDIISVSLSVQLFLLPLIIYYFNSLQIWSILANIIFTPFLSLLTVLSFLGLSIVIEPLLNLFKFLITSSRHLPFLDSTLELNAQALFYVFILINILVYALLKPGGNEKQNFTIKDVRGKTFDKTISDLYQKIINNNYMRASIIFSSILMIVATNFEAPGVKRIEISRGIIKKNKEFKKIMNDDSINHEYFKILNLDALIIKRRRSLNDIRSLNQNIKEANILVLPKLSNSDIYFDTLLDLVKPQFIICSIDEDYRYKGSSKVQRNLETLARYANTIVNSGIIYINKGKFWSIRKNG